MKQAKTRHSAEPLQEAARRKNPTAHAGPNMAAQAKFVEGINSSPYIATQRKKFQSLFGGAAQLEADPAQRVGEEEPLQGRFEAAQRVEEEEPLQGKFDPVQRVEEEEPLQGKFEPAQRVEEEEPLQGKFEPLQRVEQEEPLQGKFAPQAAQLEQQPAPRPNNAGLPDNLKTGIESLSGLSMDAVRVHYNSSRPAQLNALAYAQGTDIHIAPGQEKHLHEAWHVVQQAQGRVQPTMQMKEGVPVNDDKGLEHEADVMGAKAVQKSNNASSKLSMLSSQEGRGHVMNCGCSGCRQAKGIEQYSSLAFHGISTPIVQRGKFKGGSSYLFTSDTTATAIFYRNGEEIARTTGKNGPWKYGMPEWISDTKNKEKEDAPENRATGDAELKAIVNMENDEAFQGQDLDDGATYTLKVTADRPECKYCKKRIKLWCDFYGVKRV